MSLTKEEIHKVLARYRIEDDKEKIIGVKEGIMLDAFYYLDDETKCSVLEVVTHDDQKTTVGSIIVSDSEKNAVLNMEYTTCKNDDPKITKFINPAIDLMISSFKVKAEETLSSDGFLSRLNTPPFRGICINIELDNFILNYYVTILPVYDSSYHGVDSVNVMTLEPESIVAKVLNTNFTAHYHI